jgi:tagaturonate reductase
VRVAEQQWAEILQLAASPTIQVIASNVTEAGVTLESGDRPDMMPPRGFAARVAQMLYRRWQASRADVALVPCELLENNGRIVRDLVIRQSHEWKLETPFLSWLERSVHFANTLVDRIVVGTPAAAQLEAEWQALGYRDELLNCAEPFHLFAIEADPFVRRAFPVDRASSGVVYVDDLTPYRVRKLRLLNGPHTIVAALGVLLGLRTVRDAIEESQLGPFLATALRDELVPAVNLEFLDAAENRRYAESVLERFRNPSIEHKLRAICLNASTKIGIRLFPSIRGYLGKYGRAPRRVLLGLAAVLLALRDPAIDDTHGAWLRERWSRVDLTSTASLDSFVREALHEVTAWTNETLPVEVVGADIAEAIGRLLENPRSALQWPS